MLKEENANIYIIGYYTLLTGIALFLSMYFTLSSMKVDASIAYLCLGTSVYSMLAAINEFLESNSDITLHLPNAIRMLLYYNYYVLFIFGVILILSLFLEFTTYYAFWLTLTISYVLNIFYFSHAIGKLNID